MNAMILLLALSVQPSFLVQDVVAPRPGTAFALPANGTILRTDAGGDFPSPLSLDGRTVVRLGSERGTFREVFLAQGFEVYMHSDFLDLTPSEAQAVVRGDRVNMRLLPSAEGLMPIGQLGAGTGPLVVTGRNGDWVRLIAPIEVPLYALGTDVQAAEGDAHAEAWSALYAQREQRRLREREAWRHQDPTWQQETKTHERLEALGAQSVDALDAAALLARRAELQGIATDAAWPESRELAQRLLAGQDEAVALRATAAAATEQVKQRQAIDEAVLRREARTLALGLRFTGRGEPAQVHGSVHREGLEDAPYYTVHGRKGELLKLTAPPGVATFEALVGREVTLDGRRLFLFTVDGPVLVVEKVVVHPAR